MNYSMERLGMEFVCVKGGRIIYRRRGGDGRQIVFKDWHEVQQFLEDAKSGGDACIGCVHRFVSCSGYALDVAICAKDRREANGGGRC